MPVRVRCFLTAALLMLLVGCGARRDQAAMHVNRGDAALERRDLEAALTEYHTAIQLDPSFAPAHAGLGYTYKERGDLQKAADALQQSVKLDPEEFEPVFQLGEVYRLLERLTFAIKAYGMACQLDPRSFEAHFRLASCYHQAGELEQAEECYRAVLRLNPKSPDAWSNLGAVYDARGEYYDAIRAYKESYECPGGDQPIVLVNLATAYLNQERWQTARRTLQTALQKDEKLAVAHVRLGYCHWREGRQDDAAQSYLRAINLDSDNAEAYAGYGVVRMTQYINEPEKVAFRDEAVEAWHKSLELNPSQPKLRSLIEKYRIKGDRPTISFETDRS